MNPALYFPPYISIELRFDDCGGYGIAFNSQCFLEPCNDVAFMNMAAISIAVFAIDKAVASTTKVIWKPLAEQ